MTTLAWDGRTLAADRAVWSGAICYRVKKVYYVDSPKRGRLLVGFTGTAWFALLALDWLRAGELAPGPQCPDSDKGNTLGIVVDAKRRVWRLSQTLG